MFHQVADRDHSDYFVIVNDRQMPNVMVCHQTQTCFDSFAPMRLGPRLAAAVTAPRGRIHPGRCGRAHFFR